EVTYSRADQYFGRLLAAGLETIPVCRLYFLGGRASRESWPRRRRGHETLNKEILKSEQKVAKKHKRTEPPLLFFATFVIFCSIPSLFGMARLYESSSRESESNGLTPTPPGRRFSR